MNYYAQTMPESLAPLFVRLMNQIKLGDNMDCTEELKTLRDLYANKIDSIQEDIDTLLPAYLAYSKKFISLHEELRDFEHKYECLLAKIGVEKENMEKENE